MSEHDIFVKMKQVDGILADRLLPPDQCPKPTDDELNELRSFLAEHEAETERAKRHAADANTPREFSSTQINLPDELAARVRAMAARIADEDLAADGREDEPHITVLFGTHTSNPQEVEALLADQPPVRISIGRSSIFACEKYDVVKLDVAGDDLHRLNRRLAEALPHTSTHPTYVPHVTLAYVKPGSGSKYVGLDTMDGTELIAHQVVFSDQHRVKTPVRLAGSPAA